MKALSIQQPWAWLIAKGYKDIENRSWPTKFRGEFLIHASKKQDEHMNNLLEQWAMGMMTYKDILAPRDRPDLIKMATEYLSVDARLLGGIVGKAEIVDCVTESSSKWFQGKYGFVIANAKPLPFIPAKGKLGFFEIGGIYA